MSDAKPVDLVAARETAKRLRARDMPGAADDYDAMADEIERLREALDEALTAWESYSEKDPRMVSHAEQADLERLRALLPPS